MWLIYLLIRHHVSYNCLVINEFILIFVFTKSISQIKMPIEGLHFVCRSYVQIFICLLHIFTGSFRNSTPHWLQFQTTKKQQLSSSYELWLSKRR